MRDKRQEMNCKDVNCHKKGFWQTSEASGEIVINTKARHDGENHISSLNLAETAVLAIKQDKNFAAYFKKLLGN